MKTTKKIFTASMFTCLGIGLVITSSCIKSANLYAPAKPLPPVNGYLKSSDVSPANLVAYWPFTGTLTDSLSQTTGVATGTSFTTGVKGKGLQGANNSYVISAVPAAIQNLHSFTISVWYNMPENSTGVVNLVDIVNSQNFWGNLDIFLENPPNATTGQLKVHMWNNGTSTTGTDAWEGDYTVNNAFNVWDQVTVTYDDTTGTVTVYFNGTQVGTNTPSGFKPLNWTGVKQMVFGTLQFQTTPSLTSNTGNQSWASYLTGAMDQVRVYNKVLSLNDIGAIYGLEKLGR
jgi:Concanavalin A-like lectin/glucanases superfamily